MVDSRLAVQTLFRVFQSLAHGFGVEKLIAKVEVRLAALKLRCRSIIYNPDLPTLPEPAFYGLVMTICSVIFVFQERIQI